MKHPSVITIFVVMMLVNYNTYCSKPYTNQPGDSSASIEQQMDMQKQDTTSISQAEVWLTFRSIYAEGVAVGLNMAGSSYEDFSAMIKKCRLNWNDYLNGVFEDSIGQVDPMST